MAKRIELNGVQRLDRHLDAFEVFAHRETFAIKFKSYPTTFAFDGLYAGKALVPQVQQKLKFLFNFNFTLDFVYLCEELPAFGFDEVVSIHRTIANAGKGCNFPEAEFIGNLVGVFFR
jgi:hypothetical protein